MGKVVSRVTDLVGLTDTKGMRDAANAQANAIRESAARTAKANREQAQAAAQQQEALAARQRAADALRAQQEAQVQQQVDLTAPQGSGVEVDESTGRVRRRRDQFFGDTNTGASAGAGISI